MQFSVNKGRIAVKVDMPKEVVTESGIIIPIEQGRGYGGAKNYNAQRYAPTHGTVDAVADDERIFKKGDLVFFHYNTEQTLKQIGGVYEDADDKWFFMQTEKIVLIKRGEQLLPTEGWVICRPVSAKQEKTEGGILIPESAQKKYHDNKFVVVAVPEGYDEVAVGDTILTEKDCDRPIESNELFGELDYDLFKVETKDILAILP